MKLDDTQDRGRDDPAGLSVPQCVRELEERKAQLYAEIKNYPTPIAGCDQQFNYLLEELAKVSGELARLGEQ